MIWVVLNQKNLGKKTQSDKDLRDKVFKIAVAQKYDGYQRGLASIVYRFFDKNSIWSGVDTEPNYQRTNKTLENLRNDKFLNHLDTIFGVAI